MTEIPKTNGQVLTKWSTIVARGLNSKVPTALQRSSNTLQELQSEVLFANMFSMAGNALPQWQAMVTDFRDKWHDYNSQASLVYLGYPIYHNAYQLNGFLSKLASKLRTTHTNPNGS